MTQEQSVRKKRVPVMSENQLAITRVAQIQMDQAKQIQRINLLEYTNTNGDELVGLSVELIEDPSGKVQALILMDSNVVSGISIVPLVQGGCCG
jgi:hypothetical protein